MMHELMRTLQVSAHYPIISRIMDTLLSPLGRSFTAEETLMMHGVFHHGMQSILRAIEAAT
jgi:hypothetical protein